MNENLPELWSSVNFLILKKNSGDLFPNYEIINGYQDVNIKLCEFYGITLGICGITHTNQSLQITAYHLTNAWY